MYISFANRNVKVNFQTFQALCPGIHQQFYYDRLSGHVIAEQIHQMLDEHPRLCISGSTIRRVLIEVFQAMQSPSRWSGNLAPELRIRNLIEDGLNNDADLHQRRHTFIIICAFTKLAHSQLLAEQMANLVTERGREIEQAEMPRSLQEWSIGLKMLQNLLSEDNSFDGGFFTPWQHANFRDPMRPLMLAPHHYHRGRTPLILAAPPHYPRARSVPRLEHRHRYGLPIACPRYANSAWTSPVLSPVMRAPSPYVDEVGQLQWQQEMMNGKLDGIDHKLNNLLLRW